MIIRAIKNAMKINLAKKTDLERSAVTLKWVVHWQWEWQVIKGTCERIDCGSTRRPSPPWTPPPPAMGTPQRAPPSYLLPSSASTKSGVARVGRHRLSTRYQCDCASHSELTKPVSTTIGVVENYRKLLWTSTILTTFSHAWRVSLRFI